MTDETPTQIRPALVVAGKKGHAPPERGIEAMQGTERRGEAENAPQEHPRLEAWEQSLIDRVNALELLVESLLSWCPQCDGTGTVLGINRLEIGGRGSPELCPTCRDVRARLRDRGEEGGDANP